ncbi:MAG: gfo/Idh/MocA family oxidoreductase, partial [Bacteroidota bacterium]
MKTHSRRSFLKYGLWGTLGLAAGGAIWYYPQSRSTSHGHKKEKLGVALVGLGYYSTDLLAPALQLTQHCYLAGIVTGSPWKVPIWQKKYHIPDGNVYNYQNMSQIAN